MTGTTRTSAVWSPESSFGSGDSGKWYRFPTAVNLSLTPSNNMTYLTPIGTKFFETGVAGKFSGTGSLTFKLDYNLIDFLLCIFDTYEYDSGSGTHTLTISNGVREGSFCVRYKKMNRIVNGPRDETRTLLGCIATSFEVKQNSGSATLDCTVQFTYINEETSFGNVSETDWDDYYATDPPLPVEWTCLYIGEESVAGTESSGFSVSNGAGTVAGCGSRFDANYYMGSVTVNVNTSVYSNNPDRYLTLMYSGGFSTSYTSPKSKAVKPIPEVSLRSSETVDSDNYSLTVTFENVYVNKGGPTSFNDSKCVDSPTLRAQKVTLAFKNTRDEITAWDV